MNWLILFKKYRAIILGGIALGITIFLLTLNPKTPIERLEEEQGKSLKNQNTSNQVSDVIKPGQPVDYESSSVISDVLQQTKGEQAFNEGVQKLISAYPWFGKLPLENTLYRVVYDYERNQFRIRVKAGTSQSVAVNAALSALNNIGVSNPSYYVLP